MTWPSPQASFLETCKLGAALLPGPSFHATLPIETHLWLFLKQCLLVSGNCLSWPKRKGAKKDGALNSQNITKWLLPVCQRVTGSSAPSLEGRVLALNSPPSVCSVYSQFLRTVSFSCLSRCWCPFLILLHSGPLCSLPLTAVASGTLFPEGNSLL